MLDDLKFHHIGVATNCPYVTAKVDISAGYRALDTVFAPVQNVNIRFPAKGMCCSVANIVDAFARQRMKRFVVSRPAVACALGARLVAFFWHKAVDLIELVENQ